MRFYTATAFLFPRSYERRLLLICFVAVHVPLLACVAFQAITGHWQVNTLVVLLIATLTGTGLGLAAIHALLSPIAAATAMLGAIQNGEPVAQVPVGGDDVVGRLMRGVAVAANESAMRIADLTLAAERDPLTGIRNRRGFLDAARDVLRGDSNAVLAVIDIDHFKLINDQFGHQVGDELLKAVAQRLDGATRRTDVAGRWGGEEFAVLLPGTTLEEARNIIERLRATVALDETLLMQAWPVTFSCGLATVRDFGQFEDAVRRADAALYAAKNSGRNRVHIAAD